MCIEFFLRGWPSALSKMTMVGEDERSRYFSSISTLRAAFDLFRSNPPPPLPSHVTSNINIGWYVPLALSPSQSSPTVFVNNVSTPAIASPHAAVVGERRKRDAVDDSAPPPKRLKLMESRVEEDNAMDVDVELDKGDVMDVDTGPSVGEQARLEVQDGGMDVDSEPAVEDSLNGRLRSHAFGIPVREFSFERVTHLS